MLARYTNSEASTIVKSVTGLQEVEAYLKIHANDSRRTLGIMFRVQRECMYVSHVKLAIIQYEEKLETVISEDGKDAKLPDMWRMSSLLDIFLKDVKEDDDVTGRDRRELHEPVRESGVIHDQQGR